MDVLLNYGAIGILAFVCLYQVIFLQNKIFTLIDDNNKVVAELTKSINDLRGVIDKCQFTHIYGDKKNV